MYYNLPITPLSLMHRIVVMSTWTYSSSAVSVILQYIHSRGETKKFNTYDVYMFFIFWNITLSN